MMKLFRLQTRLVRQSIHSQNVFLSRQVTGMQILWTRTESPARHKHTCNVRIKDHICLITVQKENITKEFKLAMSASPRKQV